MRHEYRLVWMREGNTQARSKRFSNMKRLNGYLRALTAVTAEERYGDKVDKPIHPELWARRRCGFRPCDRRARSAMVRLGARGSMKTLLSGRKSRRLSKSGSRAANYRHGPRRRR